MPYARCDHRPSTVNRPHRLGEGSSAALRRTSIGAEPDPARPALSRTGNAPPLPGGKGGPVEERSSVSAMRRTARAVLALEAGGHTRRCVHGRILVSLAVALLAVL